MTNNLCTGTSAGARRAIVFLGLGLVALLSAAGQGQANGRIVQRFVSEAVAPAEKPDDCLVSPSGLVQLPSMALSPDGRYLGIVYCGIVTLEDLETGERTQIASEEYAWGPIVVMDDAEEVLFSSCIEGRNPSSCESGLGSWSKATGKVEVSTDGFTEVSENWSVSRDGRYLLVSPSRPWPSYLRLTDRHLKTTKVYSEDAYDCEVAARGPGNTRLCEDFQVTLDGRYIVFIVTDYKSPQGFLVDDVWAVHRFDTQTQKIDVVASEIKRVRLGSVDISDNGRYVSYGQEVLLPLQAGVYLKDMDREVVERLDTPTDARYTDEFGRTCYPYAEMSPDGRFVLYRVMVRQSVSVVYRYDRVTGERLDVSRTTHPDETSYCTIPEAISRDGRVALFSGPVWREPESKTHYTVAREESVEFGFSLRAPSVSRGQ